MQLTTRQVGDVTMVDVSGRITLGEGSNSLRETLRDLMSGGHTKILVNLREVSYIDSANRRAGFRFQGRHTLRRPVEALQLERGSRK